MQPKKRFDVRFSIPLWWPSLPINWRAWLPSRGNVLFTILVLGGLLWANSAGAFPLGAPSTVSTSTGTVAYQGRLADASGNPVTATVPMVFRLYNAATGSAPLWEEQWTGSNSVRVSDGLFNVMLGSLTAIPQSVVTSNASLWLGITVNADNEMQPRVQLGSVPFAVQALTVPDDSITMAKLAPDVSLVPPDGSVTSRKMNANQAYYFHLAGGTTSANTPSNLSDGPDQVSITLDVPQWVYVFYQATSYNSNGGTHFIDLAFDGVVDQTSETEIEHQGSLGTMAGVYRKYLPAGTHTIAMKYSVPSNVGGTALYLRRKILAFAVSQ